MKVSEFKKILRQHGCYFVRDGGNHEIWFSPITGRKFAVPRHNSKELASGTQNAILKEAGIE